MPHNGLPHEGEIDPALIVPPGNFQRITSPEEAPVPTVKPPVPVTNRRLVDIPGTRAWKEAQKQALQDTPLGNFLDGVAGTAAGAIYRKFKDEGALGLVGFREPGTAYDKDAFAAQSDPRLTRTQLIDILDEDTIEAATRAHARYVYELDVGQRLAAQPAGAGFATMVGSFVDIDAPLAVLSGGAFASAKLTARMIRASKAAGLTFKASERVAGVAIGLNAGIQAGAIVGLAEQATKETATWQDLAAMLLGSTFLGGALGGLANAGKWQHAAMAEKEFLARVAREDPNLMSEWSVEDMLNTNEAIHPNDVNAFTDRTNDDIGTDTANVFDDPDADGTVIGGNKPQSVGAAASGAPGRPKRVLHDPQGPILEAEAAWIDRADEWVDNSNFREKKEQDAQSMWTKLALSKIGGFSVADYNKLYTSGSAVLNYMGGVIFESASGLNRGRATSAILNEMYHRRIQTHIGQNIDPLRNAWAKERGNTWGGSGYSISAKGKKAFDRELMLEMNARAMGRKGKAGKAVTEAADRYEAAGKEALSIGVGRRGQTAVDGMHEGLARAGYNPYRWDGAALQAMMQKGVKRADIEKALANGYRVAGMAAGKDADAVAKAVVSRALLREADLDSSVMTLLSGDGREFMADSLRNSGLKADEVETLMGRLVGSAEDRAKEGFAKSRNELDMSIAIKNDLGEDIQLVDMLEQNMERTWQRYSRQVSGSSALARAGITNKAARTTFIKAAQAEQRALGEEVMETELLEAMFSHFNAGPTYGFSGGQTNKGINIFVATAKRIANLGLLEKLGITQLGETGAIIAQVGVTNWYKRGPMALWDKQMRESNGLLLKEVSYFVGDIGRDERYFAEWLDLDDVSNDHKATWINTVSGFASNAAFIQSYTSAFNHVRKYQQQMTVLGMIDKVMRTLREGDFDGMLKRFESDFGLGRLELEELDRLVENGTIKFAPEGHVTELNIDKWDVELADTFGAAMVRNMNQTVQKSMAGEQDAWMHSGWGSVMTHLMTFPMQAFQKQFIRNGRHMDLQAFAAMSFGLGTALIAVNIRDAIDGRERSQADRAKAAFSYNNMTGWIPMAFDPAMTIMGFDDYRINPYGAFNSIIPPVFTQMDALQRAPGAVLNTVTGGESDYYDRQAWKAVPFMGTYFASRVLNSPTTN